MAEKEAVVKKHYFCGHCSKELNKTKYFQHRKLFYNKKTKKWGLQKVFESKLGEDFEFSDHELDTTLGKAVAYNFD